MAGFYVLAAAVFEVVAFEPARDAMRDLRGRRKSDKLHWNEMDDQEKQTATKAVSELDGFHIVTVGAPVPRYQLPKGAQFLRELLDDCLYEVEVDTGC